MTWLIEWNGQELNIDPLDLNGLELSLIKQRTTYTFRDLSKALQDVDGDAVRALFWIAERRINPDLAFGEYEGPPIRLFLEHLDGLTEAVGDLGKAPTPETDGSPSSPSDADIPEPTLML